MTADSNSSSPTIEKLGVVVAIVTSLSLLLSFLYDWGFLSALGIRFRDAPTSLSDHISSWMVWLQVIVPGFSIAFILILLTERLDYDKDGKSRAVKPMYREPVFILAAVFPILAWLLVGHEFPWLSAGILWMMFISWVFVRPILGTSALGISIVLSIMLGPLLFLMVYSLGIDSVDLETTEARVYHVEYQVDSLGIRPVLQEGYVIRSFPNWLVVREADDSTGTVRWIRSEQVDRIEFSVDDREPFSGLLCVLSSRCIDRS